MLRQTIGRALLAASLALPAALAFESASLGGAELASFGTALLAALVAANLLLRRSWRSLDRPARPRGPLRPLATVAVLAADVVAVGYLLVVGYVGFALESRTAPAAYSDARKVWGARGLVLEGPHITPNGTQNSIESVTRALDAGAKGNEVDVFFDVPTSRFIVSHDRPYNLKNGRLLTLEELLAATGERGHYWLDFKKLRHLDREQLAAAIAELERLSRPGDLRARIWVEGENPENIAAFRRAGFQTIFDTHPLADANPLTPIVVNLYKVLYYFGGHSVMGMNYGRVDRPVLGPRTRRLLGPIPLFVYHVADDADVIRSLAADHAVRVILMQDHSLDRYDTVAPEPGVKAGS